MARDAKQSAEAKETSVKAAENSENMRSLSLADLVFCFLFECQQERLNILT